MEIQSSEALETQSMPVELVNPEETPGISQYKGVEELKPSLPHRPFPCATGHWSQAWGTASSFNPSVSQRISDNYPSWGRSSTSNKPQDSQQTADKSPSWGNSSCTKPLDSQSTADQPNDKPSPLDWTDDWPSETVDEAMSLDSVRSHEDEGAKPHMLGNGLANLGNTCFLNAVLQCFMHTVPLIQTLKSNEHTTPCVGYQLGFCTICGLRELIDASLFSESDAVSPWKFVDNLNYFSCTFLRFQQEDAHEFLQCFLDKLERCCEDSRQKDPSPSGTNNIVKHAFGGRLVSKVRCCNCGHCSDTYEPLVDLSLEIEDVESLDSALESFTKVEKIEDSEIKFICGNCKEHVSIKKQLLLDKAPSVAALHLKRFKTNGSLVEKIDKYVSFPLELDLHAYADNKTDNGEMKYDLYAVIVHTGLSYSSGHYYSFIRSAPNAWYQFDDSRVVRVREAYVLSQEAYVIFYAKRGTPWFSDFIVNQKPFIDLSLLNTSPKSVLDSGVDAVCVTSCVRESIGTKDESSPKPLNQVQDHKEKENALPISTPSPVDKSQSVFQKFQDSKEKENALHIYTPDPVNFKSQLNFQKVQDGQQVACKLHEVGKVSKNHSTLSSEPTSMIFKNVNITPKTPDRSASPEIYREDPTENDYYIPRGHLRSVDKVSCKKQLQKDLEQDMERKQACSTIKKSMRGSRAQQFMAVMRGGSHSEGSVNKKRRRLEITSK